MEMDQSEAKSADMVCKEFYAGLMLIIWCATYGGGGASIGLPPVELSFTKAHGLLASVLTELFMAWMSGSARNNRLLWLLAEASAAKLPRRRKPRQMSPEHSTTTTSLPQIKGTRDEARDALKKSLSKS